jgi:GNAT superfamily N-acetyltransferase
MVEIRPFDSAPEEMAGFLRRVWLDAGQGRVLTPLWSREYLDWQFFDNPHAERDYMLAAYDRGRMVGAFLAVDGLFRAGDHTFRGSWGSWLTVAPEYRAQFLAPQLVAAMCERHVARGSWLITGYGYPSVAGMSIEFWQAFAHAWPKVVSIGPAIAMWVRVLKLKTAMRASLSWLDTVKYGALGGLACWPRVHGTDPSVRPARVEDVPACLDLLQDAAGSLPFAFVWEAARLAHQLCYGSVAQSLVATHEGTVVAWINFHQLHLSGRERVPIGVIDHFVVPRAHIARYGAALLRAALGRMRARGDAVATILNLPMWPKSTLIRCGFVPLHLGYRRIAVWPDPKHRHPWTKRAFLLLR